MSFRFVGFRAPCGIFVFVLALLPAVFGCSRKNAHEVTSAQSADRVVILTPGWNPVEVSVELAIRPETQVRGLMGRDHLDPGHGMLFIFPDEQQRVFWMKNTLIELDIIFIRKNGEVLGCVERAEPMTEIPRYVDGNSGYVLEVTGGFCREHAVGASSRLKFVIKSININQ